MDLGASPLNAMRMVLLPLLTPALIASAIVVFAISMDDFVISAYLSSGATTDTVPVQIYSNARGAPTPALNALASLTLGVTILLAACPLRGVVGRTSPSGARGVDRGRPRPVRGVGVRIGRAGRRSSASSQRGSSSSRPAFRSAASATSAGARDDGASRSACSAGSSVRPRRLGRLPHRSGSRPPCACSRRQRCRCTPSGAGRSGGAGQRRSG